MEIKCASVGIQGVPCTPLYCLSTGCGHGLDRRFDALLGSWNWGFEGWGGPTSRARRSVFTLLTSPLDEFGLLVRSPCGSQMGKIGAMLAWCRLGVAPPCKDGCKFRCTNMICAVQPNQRVHICFDYLLPFLLPAADRVQLLLILSKPPLPQSAVQGRTS